MAKSSSAGTPAPEQPSAGARSAGAARRATYRDVLDAPEHMVAEIIAGVLHTHPRPAPLHAYAASRLGARLENIVGHGGGNGGGAWLIIFEPELHLGEDIIVPDLAGWRLRRMPTLPATAYFALAPDWVCEVLSPSTRVLDRTQKRGIYAREGVPHLWFVAPEERSVEVFELRNGHWTLLETATGATEAALPPFAGAAFNLGDLWGTLSPPKFPPGGSIQEKPAAFA